jgi:putative ABC transport system permease protein
LPFSGSVWVTRFFRKDRPPPPPADILSAHYKSVTPAYFDALRIRVLRGRTFTDRDRRGAPRVVVVNETLARRTFPDEDPIGKQVSFGISFDEEDEKASWEIVGVVADAALDRLDRAASPTFYASGWQQPWTGMSLVVRSARFPGLGEAVRKEVQAIDPELPVFDVRPMTELVSASVAERRFHTVLLTAFAGTGLGLAAIGLYGMMSLSVSRRTREIGIRMALGAPGRGILGLVLRQGMALVLLGTGLGLAGALALSRVLGGLLFGVSATDPSTFAVVAAILVLSAVLASYLPARRATQVDPLVALRYE